MKQTIKTVNPKAGTLKPINSKLKNRPGLVLKKMIAFIFMLSLAVTDLSFGQNDDSLANNFSSVASNHEKAGIDTCCIVDNKLALPVAKRNVTVVLPSSDMIHKADSEVNSNLRSSLEDLNLLVNPINLTRADEEIRNNFKNNFSVNLSRTSVNAFKNADETMMARFAVETSGIQMPMASLEKAADESLNSRFIVEQVGIESRYSPLKSDAALDAQFRTENDSRITVPANYQPSDEKMNNRFILENEGIAFPAGTLAKASDEEVMRNFDASFSVQIQSVSTDRFSKADQEILSNSASEFQSK